jgi:hypothetical protein
MRDWKKDDFPTSPFISIGLGDHVQEQGHRLLTPQLMTDSEIDYSIDALLAELERMRVEAKAELQKRQKAMLAILSAKP